ncbi:hypothetical protein ACGFX4_20330 [Kitasatospora sp. NPDC048365]|uniref:hypothetical protein n=1 Tax=Kitasatospora sp. NPDC048365 TaxID=3364050 RepID=UPI003712E072
MDGKLVDFGTEVHDLAWSPDGKHAAFIDGSGSLVVSAPDGTARTTVAKNPGGQVWTHPTWQVFSGGAENQPRNNIFFSAETNGVLRLMTVKANATGGTPAAFQVVGANGEDAARPLTTGNLWPSSAGNHGQTVYANRRSGDVWFRDDYLRLSGGSLGKGSEPAMEPDGYDVVFVRSVDGHAHLFREDFRKPGEAEDLTPKATTDYAAPAFSPDGKTIAARTAQGIVTLPADGSAAPTLVSEYTGLPAYRA